MSQNDNRLMSIGEAAKSLGITRRIILNYESKGLLTPDKKDGTTGNRYYTADSITRMRTIRILQNLGLSLDDPDSISYCIAIPQISQGEDILNLSEEKVLSMFYHGSYESIPAVRDKIIAYAKENGIPLKGTCRHIYLEGPPQHKNPSKFITQVALPIQC